MEIETLENGEAQRNATEMNSSIWTDNKANHPLTLKFKDVVYKVKDHSGAKQKVILNGISGVVQPGEVLAMLGPSGSGKTTLLAALGGRLERKQVNGKITYNGKPYSSSTKKNTGFVAQDDVMHQNLTVTETLVFTALLRLPNSLTKQQKIEHANSVVSQLGLTRCKDSRIGGLFMKGGISGGERKRVSIGQELLTKPSLLFLDEPTSGLDSTTAQMIVSILQGLASGGMTIVMSIHQPSSRLFYMFDKVLLLSEGNSLYFGNGGVAVIDYFSSIGFTPPVAMNPSDFLLDLATGITSENQQEDAATVKQTLVTAYKSNIAENLEVTLKIDDGISVELRQKYEFTTTWWQQFSVLLQRGIKERKHESFSKKKMAQILLIALVSGSLWWQSPHLQDQVGIMFFYAGFCGTYAVYQSIFTFPQERDMLAKERSSGMYRLSPYLVARTLADLPMELSLPGSFLTITYWMAGLKRDAGAYFSTLALVLLTTLVGQGIGQALGALIMDIQLASTTATVLTVTFQLIGGFYVQHVPRFIVWIKYISYIQHTYKLLLSTQYKPGQTYHCEMNKICLVEEFPLIKNMGLHGQATSVAVLMTMLVVFRLMAYIALMRVGLASK